MVWWVQADYSDQTSNLDVLILGGYWAKGRARGGRFASFLVGVKDSSSGSSTGDPLLLSGMDQDDDEDEEHQPWANVGGGGGVRFYTLGRTGSGFSTEDMAELHQQIEDRGGWKPWQVGRATVMMTPAGWAGQASHDELRVGPEVCLDRHGDAAVVVCGWCGCHQAGVLPRHFRPWRASKADLPDCWLEPQHSVVLEVKCAEITHSDMFSAGFTLR